jgi:hypothetical protein
MTRSNLAASRPAPAQASGETAPQPQSLRVDRTSGSLPTPSKPEPKERAGDKLTGVFIVIGLLLVGSFVGRSYYFAPLTERARHPLHEWLRPSGYVGQTAGILALAIFIFLWLYPLRKKYRWLSWTGVMSKWLDVHVSLALIIPFLLAIHAAWRFDGVIGLGYWSMIVVCMSGIVGRYLYVHIPRSATGLELSAEEIAEERRELITRIARTSGLPVAQVQSVLRSDPTPMEGVGFLKALVLMVRDDIARRRAAGALRRICRERPDGGKRLDRRAVREVVRLGSREMALTQQARLLGATRAIFRFWHVAHRPFALAALVAVLVHVGVVVAMGATWFW